MAPRSSLRVGSAVLRVRVRGDRHAGNPGALKYPNSVQGEEVEEGRQQRAAGGGLEHTVLLGSTATDRPCGDVQGSEDFRKRFHLILT